MSSTPLLAGILETALYVRDIEQSADFYARALGFTRLLADDRLIGMAVQNSSQVLLLFREGASTQPSPMHDGLIPPHDGHGDLHVAFALDAAAVPAWRTHLAAHGIVIESELHTQEGGISLYFRDPDHHLIELATPNLWPQRSAWTLNDSNSTARRRELLRILRLPKVVESIAQGTLQQELLLP